MSFFTTHPFKNSTPPDPTTPPPAGYFNILPYRESKFTSQAETAASAAATEAAKCIRKNVRDILPQGGITVLPDSFASPAHVVNWAVPECPPEIVPVIAGAVEFMLHFDDARNALGPDAQEALHDDLHLVLLSRWKLETTPSSTSDLVNSFITTVLDPITAAQPDSIEKLTKALLATLTTKPTYPHPEMSFDEYKRIRVKSAAAIPFYDLLVHQPGYRITDAEKASVSSLLQKGYETLVLSRDYYSFDKDVRRYVAGKAQGTIPNAIALLMRNHGYSEKEARGIVRSMILDCERGLLNGLWGWEVEAKVREDVSDRLRAYIGLFVLMVGGLNYWQALLGYYCRLDGVACDFLVEGLIGRNPKLLRLKGFALPGWMESSDEREDIWLEGEGQGNKDEVNEAKEPAKPDILAPFKKADAEEICLAPFEYTKLLPGKNTLGKFIQSMLQWYKVPTSSVSVLNKVMDMLFTTCLMLDDIEDGSHLRRGLPAAHVEFGIGQTVNSGTYLMFKASSEVVRHLRPETAQIVLDGLPPLAQGQGLDVNWTFKKKCPSINEYLVMVDHKTGGFFRLVVQAMQAEAGAPSDPDLLHLIILMGRYYQIRDDYQNLASETYTTAKGFCDDLSEGKFSFSLIHLLQNSANTKTVYDLIFGEDEVSPEAKRYILSEMEAAGSLRYTLQVLDELFESILSTLDKTEKSLGENKRLKCLVLSLKV